VTTPYSFVAPANALLFEDVTPVFVDIDPVTFNLDPARVEDALSPRTRGVLAVDVFGTPADWPALTEIAERHGLRLIDDACEALGATVEGRPIGGWGDGASFGFYPNKQITTGEGGCLTTDDADVADLCRSLRNQGRAARSRMEHVRLGFNYRLDELSAALGCAQLERLDGILERRAALAARYADAFEAAFADAGLALSEHLALPGAAPVGERSWFVYVVRLADAYAEGARDDLMERLRADGIGCAPYFPTIHLQPLYRERFGYRPGAFPVAEAAAARTLALPFHTGLSDADVARVAEALAAALPDLPRA
jgi:perosamine synthetase